MERIRDAKWIANPGCYATAALLGLAPVIKENIVEPWSIIIDGKSGTSGAGKSLVHTSLFAEVNENLRIYKVNEHQHTPEIEQQLKEWNSGIRPITFSTHLIPITRGIMATIYVQLSENWDNKRVMELYKESYQDAPFVRVRPENNYPAVKEVVTTNYCDIGLNVDERTGRLTIVSVIDNLMKGAAGQAVQNANMMFGLDQTTGLGFLPVYP
jgi:N-acetyl-gamma-glutamyl-phosphate reductase